MPFLRLFRRAKSYASFGSICTKNSACFHVNSLLPVSHAPSRSSVHREVLPARAARRERFCLSRLSVLSRFEERPQTEPRQSRELEGPWTADARKGTDGAPSRLRLRAELGTSRRHCRGRPFVFPGAARRPARRVPATARPRAGPGKPDASFRGAMHTTAGICAPPCARQVAGPWALAARPRSATLPGWRKGGGLRLSPRSTARTARAAPSVQKAT